MRGIPLVAYTFLLLISKCTCIRGFLGFWLIMSLSRVFLLVRNLIRLLWLKTFISALHWTRLIIPQNALIGPILDLQAIFIKSFLRFWLSCGCAPDRLIVPVRIFWVTRNMGTFWLTIDLERHLLTAILRPIFVGIGRINGHANVPAKAFYVHLCRFIAGLLIYVDIWVQHVVTSAIPSFWLVGVQPVRNLGRSIGVIPRGAVRVEVGVDGINRVTSAFYFVIGALVGLTRYRLVVPLQLNYVSSRLSNHFVGVTGKTMHCELALLPRASRVSLRLI